MDQGGKVNRSIAAQLGGDFIVDRDGILRLAYRSRDPADRPEVTLLLETIEATSERAQFSSTNT